MASTLLLVLLAIISPHSHDAAAPGKTNLPQNKLLPRMLSRKTSIPSASAPPQLSPEQEYALLEEAFQSGGSSLQEMFRAKREEWRELKELGLLSKLSEEDCDEDTIDLIDEENARLQRRRGQAGSAASNNKEEVVLSESERVLLGLWEKVRAVDSSKTTAVAVYALFNEIKDKAAMDTALVEDCLLALSRVRVAAYVRVAFKQYLHWVQEGVLTGSPGFGARLVNSCVSSGLADVAAELSSTLLEGQMAEPMQLVAAQLCMRILEGGAASVEEVLASLRTHMPQMAVADVNLVIRALGKARLSTHIFGVIDDMRLARLEPNQETFEFLSNAFVATVEERSRVRAMKDLPDPDPAMPEVVFVGRSNVGKSSLVNYMVNRKAVASTSATPGHTKNFHFFAVNKDRADLPTFYLVDVPGLGYAEAEETTQDSWRSLLERYVSVRDTLNIVFHLVDSRHKLTATDRQMIEIVSRAQAVRRSEGRRPFEYVVVLTKTDKASEKEVRASVKDIQAGVRLLSTTASTITSDGEAVGDSSSAGGVVEEESVVQKKSSSKSKSSNDAGDLLLKVIATSSVARVGRDELWKTLISNIDAAAAL